MILSGDEIKRHIGDSIIIEPFDESQINPNGINLKLHNELLVYEELVLDLKKPSRMRRIEIPDDGLVIPPHQLYLGRTVEWTESLNFVPSVQGRSSVARLGLFVQLTAGIGDLGYKGYWTLEMFSVQPVRIYPGVPICEMTFHESAGDCPKYNSEKYLNSRDIQPSKLFKELSPTRDPQLRLHFGQEQPD